jgi:hypothetical protein
MNKAFLFFFIFFMTNTYAFTPVSSEYFSREDWQLFYGTQRETLNKYKDGTKVTWKNTYNGHWGTITPMHTAMREGILCRDLIFFNNINKKTGRGALTFCKMDGVWKAV